MKNKVLAFERELYTDKGNLEKFNKQITEQFEQYIQSADSFIKDKGWQISEFEIEMKTEYDYGSEGRAILMMFIYRLETDDEEKQRLERAENEKKRVAKIRATAKKNAAEKEKFK